MAPGAMAPGALACSGRASDRRSPSDKLAFAQVSQYRVVSQDRVAQVRETPTRGFRRRTSLHEGTSSVIRELDVGQSALLADIAMCINYYRLFSPGLYCCIHAAVQLADGTRFCPGITVMVNHGRLKQCEPGPDYEVFTGPPNFVLDVFPGDDPLDYDDRRACFERHGVIEYVALRHKDPVEWTWNRLVDGKFSIVETADNELIMSTALPGLWMPAYALKHRDWWAVMGAIARGVSRVGHHDFMETIWKPAS